MSSCKVLLFTFFAMACFSSAKASPCCGASFLVPNLVTNDQHGHFLFSSGLSKEVQSVDTEGYWSKPSHPVERQTFQLSAAYRWNLFQMGVTLPFVRNQVESNSSGLLLSDLGFSAGWTLWDHPTELEKIIFFLQYQKPMGDSKLSTTKMIQVSSQGLSSLAAGVFFLRTLGLMDIQTMFLTRHSFSSQFLVNDENLLYQQKDSYALLLGGGYSFGKMRLGIAVQPIYEGPAQLGSYPETSLKRHTDLSLHWNYFFSPRSSWTLSYTDQTLIEAPVSSDLSRSVGISFRYALVE